MPTPCAIGFGGRVGAAAAALGCLSVLALAATLSPNPAGHGTHTQIAAWMTPCAWPVVFGIPCPTCGMTTAFAHAADGNVWAALRTQPFGGVLAIGAAVGFWTGLHACVFGSRALAVCGTLLRPRVLWWAAASAVAAWAYTIAAWNAG